MNAQTQTQLLAGLDSLAAMLEEGATLQSIDPRKLLAAAARDLRAMVATAKRADA